jgi:hypothetical protein
MGNVRSSSLGLNGGLLIENRLTSVEWKERNILCL